MHRAGTQLCIMDCNYDNILTVFESLLCIHLIRLETVKPITTSSLWY